MTNNHYHCVVWSQCDANQSLLLSKSSDYQDENQLDSKETLKVLEFAFYHHFILRPVVLLRHNDLLAGLCEAKSKLCSLGSTNLVLTSLDHTLTQTCDVGYLKSLYRWAHANIPSFSIHRL